MWNRASTNPEETATVPLPPMAFTIKTLNAFEMTRRTAVCEITATRAGHRAFVGVYPPLLEKNIRQWRIKKFEIPQDLVNGNPYDGDLVDLEFVSADSVEDVEGTLASWDVDSSQFDAPWKTDYPV